MPANEEHGGILLGRRIDATSVEVTACEFFPSAHRKGTLYDLGARERERVAVRTRELARLKADRPVGYFRSHQRPGLFLDQDDFALMEEAFREPTSVALLLRPRADGPPDAGFFFRENGDLDRKQTQLVFPFDSYTLREQGPIESPAPPSPAKSGAPRAWPAMLKRYRPAVLWAGAAVLSFAIVGVLVKPGPTRRITATNPFDLRIARNGESLLVDWNRNAPALRDATSATLTIDDNGTKQKLTLDRAELQHGSVQFWPQSKHVVVRMDVLNSREISESVTAMVERGQGEPKVIAQASKPSPSPAPAPPPDTPSATVDYGDAGPAGGNGTGDGESTRAIIPPPSPSRKTSRMTTRTWGPPEHPVQPAERSVPPSNPQPPSTSGSTAAAPQPAPAPPATPPPPVTRTVEHTVAVSVKLEPKPPSEMRKVIGHIPLLGHVGSFRYRGGEDDFHPPQPARSLEPKVPAYMLENLKRPVDIDVLVSVDKTGHVKDTEVLEGAGTGFGSLAADRAAATSWQPARVGDKPVASQVVAHFHFHRVEREIAEEQPSNRQ